MTFDRGHIDIYGTQPFPEGFKAEAERFQPLKNIAEVPAPPTSDSDWAAAHSIRTFVNTYGTAEAPADLAELCFLRSGPDLFVRARIRRPADTDNPMEGDVIWTREHVELFLKPFPNLPGMVQAGADAAGETALIWHDCDTPEDVDVEASTSETSQGWQCILRIPLTQLAAHISPEHTPAWSFIAGFAVPTGPGDFDSWQAQGHDPNGIAADPKFVDPSNRDFRLQDDSPAFDIGFLPWPIEQAGNRPL